MDLKETKIGEAKPEIYNVTCKNGTEKIINFISVQLFTGEILVSCEDFTERKKLEEQLHTMSIIDELTGLYNRRGFFTLSQQQMKLAERTKKDIALFYTDLDRMKWINDTLGHYVGDKALIEISNIFKKTFRETDIIGRIGGDEFAILAIDITTDIRPEVFLARLQRHIDTLNRAKNRKYKLSLSVGVARYNHENPCSLDELMSRADILMYEEKKNKSH
jgi:diguanylate cyclase (GGDEF)-like protein